MEGRKRRVWIYSETEADQIAQMLLMLRASDVDEIVAVRPIEFFLSRIHECFPGRFAIREIRTGPPLWKYSVTLAERRDRG